MGVVVSGGIAVGNYLTDETRLVRVVRMFERSVLIEDALTLKSERMPLSELQDRTWRLVRPLVPGRIRGRTSASSG